MTLTLSPELERLVDKKVKSGMYPTVGEVVREALRLLDERDQSVTLRREVREGFAQIERGEYTEYDEHTIKDLVADIKDRAWIRLPADSRCWEDIRMWAGKGMILNPAACASQWKST